MAAILSPTFIFLPEVIPEVEYTRKITMSISDILNFWSTLWLKYWRRYINFNIWPILWPDDVINEVVNIHLYNCSYNFMKHMHRNYSDDIFARCLIIMKNVVISYIQEYRGPDLRPPCDVIDYENTFFGIILNDLFISEVKLKLCLIFQNFQNGHYFELATNFLTGSYTGSWIYQKDSHEYFRHFELLIDALAQILTEIYHFQNLTYFVTGDVIDDVMSAWNITCTT